MLLRHPFLTISIQLLPQFRLAAQANDVIQGKGN